MIDRTQICACTLLDLIGEVLVICQQIYGKQEFSVKIHHYIRTAISRRLAQLEWQE